MVANAGTVKGKLILDTTDFTAKWKKILNDVNTSVRPKGLDSIKKQLSDVKEDAKQMANSTNSSLRKMEGDFQSYFSKVKSTARDTSSNVKESLKQINNTRFDKLSNNLDSVIRRMQNSSNSGVRAIGNKISTGLNSVKFDNLSNRFDATIHKMQNSASAGVKSISNSFSSMEASINDVFATVAGGAGAYELFNYGMGKATTTAMLSNSKSKADAATIMGQYQKYTVASSTSDSDINNILKYVVQSAKPTQTYKALNAIDAAAYTTDPIQRQELLRNFGNYLTNGYSAALFKGDVTADQAKILAAAKTPEERIAAMEQIAKQKGSMTADGQNLSTEKTGPLGKYNKVLTASDTLMRGMSDGLDKLLTTAEPLLDWFNGLDSGTQTLIGNLITFGAAVTAVSGGVRILGSFLKPLGPAFSLVKKGIGKLGDVTGVTSKLSGLKDTIKKRVGDAFSGAGDTVKSKLKNVKTKIGDALNGSDTTASNKLKNVKTKIGEALKGAADTASNKMNDVKNAITGKLNSLKDWIQKKWNPTPSSTPTTTTPVVTSPSLSSRISQWGIPVVSSAAGAWAATQGMSTLSRIGSVGMSLATSGAKGLGGTVLAPALMGATLPGGFLSKDYGSTWGNYNKEIKSTVWDPLKNATNTNIKGSLADQLNLPGWLSGNLPKAGSWLSNVGIPGMTSLNKGNSSWLGGVLGNLLPGTASAAGSGTGKRSISQDIFGKNGVLDFSRFGIKIPSFKWPSVGEIGGWIQSKLPKLNWKLPDIGSIGGWIQSKIPKIGWKLPSIGSIGSWIQSKIPKVGWRIPSLGSISSWIQGKIPKIGWHIPSLGSVGSWISSKIPRIGWSIPSWGSILQAIKDKIPKFSWPTGPGGVITGIIRSGKSTIASAKAKAAAAKQVATNAGSKVISAATHPASTIKNGASWLWSELTEGKGPRGGSIDNIRNILDDTYSGLAYMNYPGTRGATLNQILDTGGNCMDLTMAGMTTLAGYGIPSEMVWGSWNNNSHVWLRAPGIGDYDPARKILNNTSTPPARGPGESGSKTIIIEKGAVQINAPVYGVDDLDAKIENGIIKGLNKYLA